MVHANTIRAYARKVAREFNPRRIILFGSYAYGRPSPDSDVDLLVVLPHRGHSADAALRIRSKLEAPFPMDLLVRSPSRIRQRMRMRDYFIREVMTRGKVLHETRDQRMGGKGRG
jgi:predicted nucleotidyltransferase